jgi:hypothetical protein
MLRSETSGQALRAAPDFGWWVEHPSGARSLSAAQGLSYRYEPGTKIQELDYRGLPHCGFHSRRAERMRENNPITPSA